MEIIIKGVLVHSLNDIEIFDIKANDSNKMFIIGRLEYEKAKAIRILKRLQIEGKIKSLSRPKNKQMQEEINKLILTKKVINKSIDSIKMYF